MKCDMRRIVSLNKVLLSYCANFRSGSDKHRSLFFLRMASGDSKDDSSPSPSPIRRRRQESGCEQYQHCEEIDDLFSVEDSRRRPSTLSDAEKLEELLREVLTFRDSNVSSWIVENRLKNLCGAYKYLLKPHREKFLKVLACEHSVDHNLIRKAAKSLEESDKYQLIKGEEKLKNLLTPEYAWLFLHIGRLEKGVKFLVDLRTDLLNLLADTDSKDSSFLPLQQLNVTLKEMLSLWFSVGFLNLERITWKSPCDMLQKISEYEAVHPVRNWADLKRRVGPYRRCFVYTHSSMPDEPLVVLHTALSDEIASSMKGIVSAASRMSMDANAVMPGLTTNEVEDPNCVKAAVFYSISSTQKGLQGIELGNYLIKRVVQELQAEFPQVSMFSSLSPIPTFRSWLMDKLKGAERGSRDLLTEKEERDLQQYLKTENIWTEVRKLMKTNSWITETNLVPLLETPLMRLCARYLYLEKRRGYALDSVANFHLKNGAVMWRINWQANLTPRGLDYSCGMMVNYRYFLDKAEENSHSYLEKQHINASDQVLTLVSNAQELIKVTSKI